MLAGGLAHEIKNPLSTIGLNLELLAEEVGEGNARAARLLAAVQPGVRAALGGAGVVPAVRPRRHAPGGSRPT